MINRGEMSPDDPYYQGGWTVSWDREKKEWTKSEFDREVLAERDRNSEDAENRNLEDEES